MQLKKPDKIVLALAGIWMVAFAIHAGCESSPNLSALSGVGNVRPDVVIDAEFAKAPLFVAPESVTQRTNYIDVSAAVPADGQTVQFNLPTDSVAFNADSLDFGKDGELEVELVVSEADTRAAPIKVRAATVHLKLGRDGSVNVIDIDNPIHGRNVVDLLAGGEVSVDVVVKGNLHGAAFVDGARMTVGFGTGAGNTNDNTAGNTNDNTADNTNDNSAGNANDNTDDNGNANDDPTGNDNTAGNTNDNTAGNANDNTDDNGNANDDPTGNDNTAGNTNDNTVGNTNDNTDDNGNANDDPTGNDNTGGNTNDNTGGNANDNTDDNGNANDDPTGNDNTTGNTNDNTGDNTNDNTGGNANDNTGGNTNDNTGNGNDNTSDGVCSDGSIQLRVEVEGPGDFEVEARYRENGDSCREFRLDIEGFATGSYDVFVNDTLVGQIFADSDDGEGRLRLDTENGNFPSDFPFAVEGDVVWVGDVIGVVLQSHCSEPFVCGNMNGNDNTGGNGNDNTAGNMNDNGG